MVNAQLSKLVTPICSGLRLRFLAGNPKQKNISYGFSWQCVFSLAFIYNLHRKRHYVVVKVCKSIPEYSWYSWINFLSKNVPMLWFANQIWPMVQPLQTSSPEALQMWPKIDLCNILIVLAVCVLLPFFLSAAGSFVAMQWEAK